jgi:predicted dehydrogenase
MSFNVGIIGASFAKAAMLPALATIDDAEVVAVASRRLASAQAAADAFGVSHAYDDWRAMLEAHRFDLVCVATPTNTHASMTLAALDAGANVLCEKPMAMNRHESIAMLEKADGLGRLHMIDHELRFNPNRRKIKSLIESGAIGEVRHVNLVNITPSWGDPASRPAGDWWSLAETGGGRLGANGSHQIDLVRFWLGDVGSVNGQIKTVVAERVDKNTGEPWTATADDLASFTLEMQGGALVSVFMSGAARHGVGNSTQIYGSEGTIMLADGDEKLLFAKAGEDFRDVTEIDPNAGLPGVGPGIWNVSVVALMNELVAAMREGRSLKEGATFVDGLACQEVMDAVRRSSAERRWIDLTA